MNELETTTVWILPYKDFEERLNKNVIDRYSSNKKYSTIFFVSHSKNKTNLTERKGQICKELIFIKSPFLTNNNPSRSEIEHYLNELKEIVRLNSPTINKGGFLVIQTQDIRIDNYIEPLAKNIVDLISSNNLWLKEIIVATHEEQKSEIQMSNDYLKISHQYLLVYKKIDGVYRNEYS